MPIACNQPHSKVASSASNPLPADQTPPTSRCSRYKKRFSRCLYVLPLQKTAFQRPYDVKRAGPSIALTGTQLSSPFSSLGYKGEGDHFRTPILDHFRTPMSWIIFEHRLGHFRTHGGAILRHPWGGGGGGVGQLRSPLTACPRNCALGLGEGNQEAPSPKIPWLFELRCPRRLALAERPLLLREKAVQTREISSSELSCPRDTKNLLSSYGLSNLQIGASWNCDRRLLRGGATAYWGWGGGGVGQLRSLLAA